MKIRMLASLALIAAGCSSGGTDANAGDTSAADAGAADAGRTDAGAAPSLTIAGLIPVDTGPCDHLRLSVEESCDGTLSFTFNGEAPPSNVKIEP